MWYLTSLVIWALDWWTTTFAIANGALEGNPVAAYFHQYLGISGYALAILPLILVRAYIASSHDEYGVWRLARNASRFFLLVHVIVVVNNLIVIATL